jgi:hypothetical protein
MSTVFVSSWVLAGRKTFREKRDPLEHAAPGAFFCQLPAKGHAAGRFISTAFSILWCFEWVLLYF